MKPVKYLSKIILPLTFIFALSSCSVIEQIAGVNYDLEQFQLQRQLKIKELTLESTKKLQRKISNPKFSKEADIVINFQEKFLNKLFNIYKNQHGWIDAENSYYIKDIRIELLNGVGIASIDMIVKNTTHDIKVVLATDCLILIEKAKDILKLKLEPFNISPLINSKGFYKIFNTSIDKSIRLNLTQISKKLPAIPIPINLNSDFQIKGLNENIKSGINLRLNLKDIKINTDFVISDIVFINKQMIVLLNISQLQIK